MTADAEICNGGVSKLAGGDTGGIFLPIGGNWERTWGREVQAFLIFLGLIYCFAGVAFIADVFMASIEKITSQKVRLKEGGHFRTYNVWNPTIANLTLMALGSSAPEILLSVIELISNGMHSGELGPSTIVGSAAFNLHVILAVCVVCIPAGELRSIKELPVFAITASFSVFAYVWIVFILLVTSPNVVEWWEGLLTFLFFPVLICFAYAADAGYLNKLLRNRSPDTNSKLVLTKDSTEQDKAEMMMQIRKKYGQGQNVLDFMEQLIHYEFDPRPTRAQRRRQATRDMFKGKPLPFAANETQEKFGTNDPGAKHLLQIAHGQSLARDIPCHVEHSCTHYMVNESDKKVDCVITRTGDFSRPCKVHVKTVDGTAKAKDDYVAIDQDIKFNRFERSKTVTIAIVEDTEYEDTEHFQLHLSIPPECSNVVGLAQERGGTPGCDVARVLIFDNNHPGVFGFKDYDISVPESCDAKSVTVDVHRRKGTYGKVSCKFRTQDMTATENFDYEPISGTLEFDHGEAVKTLALKIKPKVQGERTEQFRLIISDATGQATFDDSEDGSETSCICTITIQRDLETRTWLGRLADMQALNADQLALGKMTWREQFIELKMGDEPAGPTDYAVHLALFPWKLICACVPPPTFCGGWVCFVAALAVIGALTALIGDLAEMLGCALLPMLPSSSAKSITAVTIVALGTSLPDTFASKKSAVQDPTADASIGNVTGSNSVNVFLGLGLPWMIGAFYWKLRGVDVDDPTDPWVVRGEEAGWLNDPDMQILERYPATFVVPAGSLGTSVAVFTVTAVLTICLLMARRLRCGGELGGPSRTKWASAAAMLSLWLFYVVFSIVQAISEVEE
jgi:solute carrier family 8 (sodium/calcium exchanger)